MSWNIFTFVFLLPVTYFESCPLIALLPHPSGHAGRSRSGLKAQRTIEAKNRVEPVGPNSGGIQFLPTLPDPGIQ